MYINENLLIDGTRYVGYEINQLVYDLITLSLKLKVIYIEKSKFGSKQLKHEKWFEFDAESEIDINFLIDKIIEYHERFTYNS